MRNYGDFCPKCPKGRQMTRLLTVFECLAGIAEPHKYRIAACTTCRWAVRSREVAQGVYRKVEACFI